VVWAFVEPPWGSVADSDAGTCPPVQGLSLDGLPGRIQRLSLWENQESRSRNQGMATRPKSHDSPEASPQRRAEEPRGGPGHPNRAKQYTEDRRGIRPDGTEGYGRDRGQVAQTKQVEDEHQALGKIAASPPKSEAQVGSEQGQREVLQKLPSSSPPRPPRPCNSSRSAWRRCR